MTKAELHTEINKGNRTYFFVIKKSEKKIYT